MNLYFNLAVCIIGVILTASLEPSATSSPSNSANFATGTVLFHNKKCWQHEDLALLNSRKTVQNLIPTNKLDVTNDGYITNVIDYFRMCFSTTQKMSSGRSQDILLLALADAIGGYLHYYVIPVTKEAFYCGNIRYDSATKLYNFYEDIKVHLDTSGKRWATPMDTSKMEFKTRALTVAPPCQDQDPCAGLLLNDKPRRNSRECTSEESLSPSPIPMPFMDDAEAPTSIAVPFRESNLMPLTSPRAAFVLEKYYVAGVQCLMSRSGDDSQEDLAAFEAQLYRWLEQMVVPLLKGDNWYPAFGGVRKILKTIESHGHADVGLEAEMPPTSGQQEGSLDSDVQDEVMTGGDGQSSVVIWGWLVAVGFGTLTAWIAMALLCTFLRCSRRRQEERDKQSGLPDGGYQLINTFVQIFYDMRDCGRKPEPIASSDKPDGDRRLKMFGKNRRHSKTSSERVHSTPEPDRRQSVTSKVASHSATDLEDQGEDHGTDDEEEVNERSHLINDSEGHRRRSDSMKFGRNSTTIEQVQTKQAGSGSSRPKNQRMKNTVSPGSLFTKDSKGKLSLSTDSSRTFSGSSIKHTTSSEMAYNSDSSEVSTSASEDEVFTRNASR